jgi:hydrogenase maturation protein HypF
MGRLFDAVAAILGIRQFTQYEGQTAMETEFTAQESDDPKKYRYMIRNDGTVDWEMIIIGIVSDIEHGFPNAVIAKRFHNSLVGIIVSMAERIGFSTVVLSGGCFQNRLLVNGAITELRAAGFDPYINRQVPTNDGGISLGQIRYVQAGIREAAPVPPPPPPKLNLYGRAY